MIEFSLRTREYNVAISITQKIIDDLTEDIRSGRLRPGEKIPSATELRATYGCSISPVRDAIRWLKAVGLVEGSPGVGVYVKERESRSEPADGRDGM